MGLSYFYLFTCAFQPLKGQIATAITKSTLFHYFKIAKLLSWSPTITVYLVRVGGGRGVFCF